MLNSPLRSLLRSHLSNPALHLVYRRRFQSSLAGALDKIREGWRTSADTTSEKRIFIGTGQYHQHTADERIVVLSLGVGETPRAPLVLLDSTLPSLDVEKLEERIGQFPRVLCLVTGEVDCVNENQWQFGFERKPGFSIFSASGVCCELKEGNLQTLTLRIFHGSLHEDISLSDIKHAQVTLSPEPWNERKLEIKLNDDELLTVVEDISVDESGDLGLLMMSTEWLVKAGGHLCLMLYRVMGQPVPLLLPNVLRADGNPYISLRNKAWAETSSKSNLGV